MSTGGKNVDGFSLFIFLEALEPPTRLVMENNVLIARVHKTRDSSKSPGQGRERPRPVSGMRDRKPAVFHTHCTGMGCWGKAWL